MLVELDSANKKYCEKLQANENSQNVLFAAGWKVEELRQLVDHFQNVIRSVTTVNSTIADDAIDKIETNIARQLSGIRETATTLSRDLSRHKRVSATHIFVMMISCEQRNVKPYSLPVQCLPYHSINQQKLRQLISKLVKEMTSRGMKVAGLCAFLSLLNYN